MESNREVSSLDSFEGNMSTDMNEGCDLLPLFVHFTCTIKQRSNVQHASVRRVPLCLGESWQPRSDVFKLSFQFQNIDLVR